MSVNNYLMMHKLKNKLPFGGAPHIVCADGFKMSVQAGLYLYCEPELNQGPWETVEVGYPSQMDLDLMPYAESPENPTRTVYGHVPVYVVDAVIAKHGGMEVAS